MSKDEENKVLKAALIEAVQIGGLSLSSRTHCARGPRECAVCKAWPIITVFRSPVR